MRMIEQVSAMRAWSRQARGRGKARIALVPTMGGLHAGHLSLVEIARRHADLVVVSVFVNPTQFDRVDDFARYPRSLERDRVLLANAGADVLFAPGAAEMYAPGADTFVTIERLSAPLCGAHRPGHFRGVATVVLKLFAIVEPQVAVFGEKDYQQLVLVRRMVSDLCLDIEIVGAPIVREKDGLAMSSRNQNLNPDERAAAGCLWRGLEAAQALASSGTVEAAALTAAASAEIAREPLARAEYVSVVDAETLEPVETLAPTAPHGPTAASGTAAVPASRATVAAGAGASAGVLIALAVWIGNTRLIDNRLLTVPAASRERRSA